MDKSGVEEVLPKLGDKTLRTESLVPEAVLQWECRPRHQVPFLILQRDLPLQQYLNHITILLLRLHPCLFVPAYLVTV